MLALRFVSTMAALPDMAVIMLAAVITVVVMLAAATTLQFLAAALILALILAAHTHGCCKNCLNRAASADWQLGLPASTGAEQCAHVAMEMWAQPRQQYKSWQQASTAKELIMPLRSQPRQIAYARWAARPTQAAYVVLLLQSTCAGATPM